MAIFLRRCMVGMAVGVAIMTGSNVRAIDIDADQNARIKTLEEKVNMSGTQGKSKKTDPNLEEKLKQIDVLQKEVADLKAFNASKNDTKGSCVLNTYGSLTLKGIIQAWYDTGEKATPADTFTLKRCRIILSGQTPVKQISYFIQTDMASSPALLDAKMMFSSIPYLPFTTINVGRFVPSFTYYMPRSVSDLDLILYPIVINQYGMFRQNGAQVDVKTKLVTVNGGVFNGYPANSTNDNDGQKDYLGRLEVTPLKDMSIFGYRWEGRDKIGAKDNFLKNRTGGGLAWRYKICNLVGEYIQAYDQTSLTSHVHGYGAYANLGVKVVRWLEVLGRYDWSDPNTHISNNREHWITSGINILMDENHAKLSVNYVVKQEETNHVDNNEFVTQMQIFF